MRNYRAIKGYEWLLSEKSPKILLEALKEVGTKECTGEVDNPVILGWAKELGGWIADWYNNDSIPWCGLFMGVIAKRAGFPHNQKALSAREWSYWGQHVEGNAPMLGDVCIFQRPSGGHVGIYVGEDTECYHILGGNQSDSVNIARISKDRFLVARRCKWKIAQPRNIRRVYLRPSGRVSHNEA